MMKTNITKEDAIRLREELRQYADTAEQYEFPLLAMIHYKLVHCINDFDTMSIEEKNSMFRTVYKVIGKDYSEYEQSNS